MGIIPTRCYGIDTRFCRENVWHLVYALFWSRLDSDVYSDFKILLRVYSEIWEKYWLLRPLLIGCLLFHYNCFCKKGSQHSQLKKIARPLCLRRERVFPTLCHHCPHHFQRCQTELPCTSFMYCFTVSSAPSKECVQSEINGQGLALRAIKGLD